MKIKTIPVRHEPALVAVLGDVLTINGASYDFSRMNDGDVLDRSFNTSGFFMSDVERIDGEICLTIIQPLPAHYDCGLAHPTDLGVVPDGEVPFIDCSGPDTIFTDPVIEVKVGEIDWSKLKTASALASGNLANARFNALTRNNSAYEAATVAVTSGYPQMEKDTWPTQDREVKAWLADPETALTPWIDTAAAIRGIDRTVYLARTLQKTQQFEQISAYLTGFRQKYEDQIKVATTVEALEAINCVYNLPQG